MTFQKVEDKIKNYCFNSLLCLNERHAWNNFPVYAGRNRFIKMSRPNVRNFLELCYNTLQMFSTVSEWPEVTSVETFPTVDVKSMHEGAVSSSSALVKEIVDYPPHGRALFRMAQRIGEIFSAHQNTLRQSEPERNIFRIAGDFDSLPDDIDEILRSAICWRVLIKHDITRVKMQQDPTNLEYQLNPIYSCDFGISFNKGRDISFTVEELKTLLKGSLEEYTKFRTSYLTRSTPRDGGNQESMQFD